MAALKSALLGLHVLAWGTLIVALGGLASLQSWCLNNGDHMRILNKWQQDRYWCDNPMREAWWAWALSAAALMLLALASASRGMLQRFKAATAGVLISSVVINMYTVADLVSYSEQVQDGSRHSSAIAAYVGLALFDFFAFLLMFTASAYAYSKQEAGMGGLGIDSLVRQLPGQQDAASVERTSLVRSATRRVKATLDGASTSLNFARTLFLATTLLAAAGCVITLGGAGGLTAHCLDDNEALQSSPWFSHTGANYTASCGNSLGGLWWAWALQAVTLVLVGCAWNADTFGRFKAASFAVAVSSVTYNNSWANSLIVLFTTTEGSLRSRAIAAFSGLVVFNFAGYLLLFAISSYTWARRRANIQSFKLEASQSRVSLTRNLYVASLMGGWVALFVALGGLAALQASLDEDSDERRQAFGTSSTRFTCWVLALVGMALASACLDVRLLRPFKSAVWMVCIAAVTLNMGTADMLYRAFPLLSGTFLTRAAVTFGGLVGYDVFVFGVLFSGSAFAWKTRQKKL